MHDTSDLCSLFDDHDEVRFDHLALELGQRSGSAQGSARSILDAMLALCSVADSMRDSKVSLKSTLRELAVVFAITSTTPPQVTRPQSVAAVSDVMLNAAIALIHRTASPLEMAAQLQAVYDEGLRDDATSEVTAAREQLLAAAIVICSVGVSAPQAAVGLSRAMRGIAALWIATATPGGQATA